MDRQAGTPAAGLSQVLPPARSLMKVSLVLNEQGQAYILHDRQFSGSIEWVEYDADLGSVACIMTDGSAQDLGFPVPAKMKPALMRAQTISVAQVDAEGFKDFGVFSLAVRSSGVN